MMEEEQKPEGNEKDYSELAKHSRPQSEETGSGRGGVGRAIMRGCGIAVGIVALIFFFIVGTCFLR